MDERLFPIVRECKKRLEREGFIILGVFGSRARGDQNDDSDLDLLFKLELSFYDRYQGWELERRLCDIRDELRERIGLRVDLADIEALRGLSRELILSELIDVA